MDAFFSDKKPSSIACAAMLVVMDLLHFLAAAFWWFIESLNLNHDAREVNFCVGCLHQISSEVNHHQPAVMRGDCPDHQTSETDQVKQVQIITLRKGNVPSSLERMCQEAITKPSNAGGSMTTSPNKRRVK